MTLQASIWLQLAREPLCASESGTYLTVMVVYESRRFCSWVLETLCVAGLGLMAVDVWDPAPADNTPSSSHRCGVLNLRQALR